MPKAELAFSRANEIYDTTIGWRFINPQMRERWGRQFIRLKPARTLPRTFRFRVLIQDAFAARSQERAVAAQANGRLAEKIAPVSIPQRKGPPTLVERDEHPRPGTTVDVLAKLPTPFRKNGTVTAGNSSGVNDGAAALLIASEAAVRRHGLTPIARILGGATAGVAPRIMGVRPGTRIAQADGAPQAPRLRLRRCRVERGLRQPGLSGRA